MLSRWPRLIIFKHLLERLSLGCVQITIYLIILANSHNELLASVLQDRQIVKVKMATTLAEMELTDHYKSDMFEQGVLNSLLQLISEGDDQMKEVEVTALQNLSSLPRNGWLKM